MSVKVHEPVCLDSSQDWFFWFDHFLGDQLKDEWRTAGTGSAVVIDQETGGIVRVATGATTGNSHKMDWSDIRSLHVTKKATMEWRAKLNADDTTIVFSTGLFFNNNDRVIFTAGAGPGFNIFTADDGANTNLVSGISLDTSYHVFRIECHTHGASHVHFYIDGTETANSPITTNIPDDAADYLQPFFLVITGADAIRSLDLDYVVVRQER